MRIEFLFSFTFLVMTIILAMVDALMDFSEGSNWMHIGIELGLIAFGLIGAVIMARKVIDDYRSQINKSQVELEQSRQEAETWKKEAHAFLKGLALQIDQQFSNWQFTAAEKEVAMLLIKGLSIRDIAAVRGVTEKTIRQQCLAIYRKSGLAGRSELSAFFLEDLLIPAS